MSQGPQAQLDLLSDLDVEQHFPSPQSMVALATSTQAREGC